MSEALVATMGILGVQLANTFGAPRHRKEEGGTTWRRTRGYEHLEERYLWKGDVSSDAFWSDHELLSLTAPSIENIQLDRASCLPRKMAHWHVDPGVPSRDAAALFDRALLPSSRIFG
eukprot:7642827-Pyramimonas_sp.AAC.1